MEYTVNYINDEVMEMNDPEGAYIKYPGGKWDYETLEKMVAKKYKVVLHGIIPSSGSILDPRLCDHLDEFSKFVRETHQKWLSFHLESKVNGKYGDRTDYDAILQENLQKIRAYFPDMPVLIETMPPVDNIHPLWCNPEIINTALRTYDLGLLLDVPHCMISAEYLGMSFEDYISQLDLDRVVEIHFCGTGKTHDGKLYDAHAKATEEHYKNLECALKRCPNLQMLTLEFSPGRDYDGEDYARKYREARTNEDLFAEQQEQLQRIKEIYEKVSGSEPDGAAPGAGGLGE